MAHDSSNFTNTDNTATAQMADGSNSAQWYLIYTRPRQEYRAAENLQRQGFAVFLPTLEVERLHRGKLHLVVEPLFKRYLFVLFDAARSPWHTIRSTLGVSELARTGDQLTQVPEEIIAALMQQAPPARQTLFAPGDRLRVTQGPFRDLEVVFEMQDGEQRAIVLIEMLNKVQKISISTAVLRK